MILRKSFLPLLLVSIITIGLSSSTLNLAAPKASKEPIDPRFYKLPPGLRERLEKRMRTTPRTKAAPQGRAVPLKPRPAWVQQLGTPESDYATAVAVGPQDNIYVTGNTNGTLGNQNYGGDDVWLAKYGPGRKLLWKVQLGSDSNEYSYDVAVDSKGYAYMTGYTDGKLGVRQYGDRDAWVAKYSPSGKLQWKKQLGTSRYDYSSGIATDSSGNVYLTGGTLGKLGGQQYGGFDVWLAKYSPTGKLQWIKQSGNSDENSSRGIATDSSGNIYLSAGSALSGLGAYTVVLVAKFDSSGTQLWERVAGSAAGPMRSVLASGIATDNGGNVYLTEYTSTDFRGGYAMVYKYDSSGTLLWSREIDSSDSDSSSDITTDNSGNAYITGATYGKLGDQQYGSADAWVAKYDSDGTQLWTKQLGTANVDFSYGVAIDSSGNIYLAGATAGILGDQQYGNDDAWLVKYKP
jgi:hypothetical protein